MESAIQRFPSYSNISPFCWNTNITTADFKQTRKKMRNESHFNCCSITLVKWLECDGQRRRETLRDSDKDWKKFQFVCLGWNTFIRKSTMHH